MNRESDLPQRASQSEMLRKQTGRFLHLPGANVAQGNPTWNRECVTAATAGTRPPRHDLTGRVNMAQTPASVASEEERRPGGVLDTLSSTTLRGVLPQMLLTQVAGPR